MNGGLNEINSIVSTKMFWWLLVIFLATWWYLNRIYKHWPQKGVKQVEPVPIFGNFLWTFMKRQPMSELVQDIYNKIGSGRYIGLYQFNLPTLMIKDPELIKQIGIKDFDHFLDHRTFIPEDNDPLWGKNLFALKGQKWRDMRSTLSPAFTSSKMKFMFNLMVENGEELLQYFFKQDKDLITIEMKDICTRYANDVIASTAFGVKCDSLTDRENEFYLMGKETTDFTEFRKMLKFFGYLIFPSLYKAFNIKLFSDEVSNFFLNLVKNTVKVREESNTIRPDMIHLLMQARKNELKYEENEDQSEGFATVKESEVGKISTGHKKEISDMDMTSQALIFFFAGFDVLSATMCFMAHELAVNPDIQKRLISEIDEAIEDSKGKLTYERLLKMQYLDMVVSETLRKWPVTVAVDRTCTKPYTIEAKRPNEKPVHLKVNDVLWFPIFAIQRDPNNFPNPEVFDPERFNEANKHKIKPCTYLSFGVGPRNCIGSRFALLEIKSLIYHLLSHYEIVTVEKTQIPLKLMKGIISLHAEDGFWLGLKKRTKT